jgi:ferredoxin/flavodoxin---NADP+ reductase
MMKVVSDLTKKYDIKTMVSLNPIMVDGTGMCGGCRVISRWKNQVCLC